MREWWSGVKFVLYVYCFLLHIGIYLYCTPVRARGVKSRMCPPYPQRGPKRRLNGAVCRNHRIKRLVPCRWEDGHVKEPYEMSMAWEPDRRSNFFSPPAQLCAVTYMTEILLIVTLNNQFTLPYLFIVQIAKRHISPVFAFNVQIPDQLECLVVFACWKQTQDLYVSLLFVQ